MVVSQTVQALLFTLFADLTALLQAVVGPTYDDLLAPSLSPSALYPTPGDGAGFLGAAPSFGEFVVLHLVDPAVPLVAAVLGAVYLARVFVPRLAQRTQAAVPKLVVAVLLANLTLPVTSALLGLAGAGYPVLAGYDGGAWRHWAALGGPGFFRYSWDNGVLALVLSFVLFTLVLLLLLAIAVRDALLGVLLVLLPVFTLLYPVPFLAPLAQRGWMVFGQLAFLPWIVVVPLELAVGAPTAPLLVGYLTVALAAPALLAVAGERLSSLGFPTAGSTLSFETSRSLGLGSSGAGAVLRPAVAGPVGSGAAVRGAVRSAASVPIPAAAPLLAAEMGSHAVARLVHRLASSTTDPGPKAPRFPAVRPPPSRGPGR